MNLYKIFIVLLFCLTLCSCSDKPIQSDLANVSQDPVNYVNPKTANQLLISKQQAKILEKNYLKQYFSPWTKIDLIFPISAIKPIEIQIIENSVKKPGFAENKLPVPASFYEKIKTNMQLNTYPNMNMDAITLHNAEVRSLPTIMPVFVSFHEAGQGYPFNVFATQTIPANEPVRVIQTSKDGAWDLIIDENNIGWIQSQNIAYVDYAFRQKWQNKTFVVPTQDHISLYDKKFNFLQQTRIGELLPIVKNAKNHFEVMVAIRNKNNYASSEIVHLAKKYAKQFPIAITQHNIATLANQMIGDLYGWGGEYQLRDCSETMMDLFTPFAIWLPRTSTDQAHTGTEISLAHLSNTAKKAMIIHNGIPFLTIVHLPGHIMLYLGHHKNTVYVFHDVWGLGTKNWITRKEGRAIIGKTIISKITLGKSQSNIPENLLDAVNAITILGQGKIDYHPKLN